MGIHGGLLPAGLMAISDQELGLIRSLVRERFGINLTEQKRALVVGRLQKFLREQGFPSFRAFYDHLVSDASGRALDQLINRISTNYTFFNRERAHFDLLARTVLPGIIRQEEAAGSRDLRLWSAGCSSGEEAYLLAILLMEALGVAYPQWQAGVLATDISERVLAVARQGVYAEDSLADLPDSYRKRYFQRLADGRWQVAGRLRQEVTFRRFNLMSHTFPFKKPFQVIFCRNVMIYFDRPTRDALVSRFQSALEPGGLLFIGHSESLGREQGLFRYLMPAVYQRL
ncbi:MAG: protein-glutamate O-methyltransferase CheR [Thermodesulfobacteriota bacterium]